MTLRRSILAKATMAAALTGLVSGGLVAAGQAAADPSAPGVRSLDAAGRLTGVAAGAGEVLLSGGSGNATGLAMDHLAAYADDFGIDVTAFTVDRAVSLPAGTAVRFQQTVDSVPVLGGQLVAMLDPSGALLSLHGNVSSDEGLEAAPSTEPAEARSDARHAFAAEAAVPAGDLVAERPRLAWFDPALWAGTPSTGDLTLVWAVAVEPQGLTGFGGEVLYDAHTGAEVLRMSHKREATRSICDADGTYVSVDTLCSDRDAVRSEGDGATGDADVDAAYDLFGATSDYYADNFGYDLTAEIGSTLRGDRTRRLRAIVKACVYGYGCPMRNAFWNGKGMTFGPGFASADDVIAHELTHGVTEFTSGLSYSSQSGAINESLSDVFGEFSDLTNGYGNDGDGVRWDMGEDLPPEIGTIRSLSDPTRFGDPDRVTSGNWYSGGDNSAYVHINSGVGNKAAFLVADGGSFNGRTITGLGLDKAAQIWWQAENTLTSSATYAEFGDVLSSGCRALASAGTAGITESDCIEVDEAVAATEMGETPAG